MVYFPTTHTPPRIAVISYKGLSRLVHGLVPNYRGRAEIRIIDRVFAEAVDIAHDIDLRGDTDVFLSAGANGAFLRDTVSLPVVQIAVTGFDLMRAFVKARKISERIALVTYKHTNTELEDVKQILGIKVEQRSYITVDDAKEQFHDLAAQGYKVIIGSSLVVELAEREGLTGILVYSPHSIQQAIENAIEISQITQTEEARTKRLNTILSHINEGVVAVDPKEHIQSLNPAMESLLGITERDALGKRLSKIAPELSMNKTLGEGRAELQKIQRLGHKTIVTNRIPIKTNGTLTGAVLTFQDAHTIEQADRSIRAQNSTWKLAAKYRLSNIICCSDAIQQAKNLSFQYAKTDSTILITGESGTGKELFAQGIHNASKRKNRPFVTINCAAIPESLLESELFGHEEGSFTGSRRGGRIGLFETAHTGTIFLDEIGDMPISLQTRLLRVLQEKEVVRLGGSETVPIDVHIIAATNKNLKDCIARSEFREDLYYRLNILHMHIPPIREHKEDIPGLMRHLLREALHKIGSKRNEDTLLGFILPHLQNYNWPGNVREMENISERLAVFYNDEDIMSPDSMNMIRNILPEVFGDHPQRPSETNTDLSLKAFSHSNEFARIQQTINECDGNLSKASVQLGISRTTLWRKLLKYKDQPSLAQSGF